MKMLPLLFRNLTRNRRRTLLTVISIAVSIFIFAGLISLPGFVDEILRDPANSLLLVCYSKASLLYALPESYRRRIEKLPHVTAVMGESIFLGTYRDPNLQLPAVAMDSDRVREMFPDWNISADAERKFTSSRTACLVGPSLMRRYRWKVGDQFTIRGIVYPVDAQLTIVGTISGGAPDGAILFRREYLEELIGRPGNVNLFWIKMDAPDSAPFLMGAIDEMFANSAHETVTQSEDALIRNQMEMFGVLFNGVKLLATIVVFAIALVAANTGAMAIRERRQEIAVMRAIGFTRGVIVASIAAEGLVIGIVSGILGCALGRLAFLVLPHAAGSLGVLALRLRLPLRVQGEGFAVAVAVGAISALIPAALATRGSVSGSLRAVN